MTFARFLRFWFAWALCLGFSALPLPAATTGSVGSGAVVENRQRTIELNYMICVNGEYPSPDGGISRTSDGGFYLGEIRLFAANFVPGRWLPCDGRLLSLQQNVGLFSLLGTTYGGDGVTNFALPDLRERVPIGRSPELELGAVVGSASLALTAQQMPAHRHTMPLGATGSGGGTDSLDNRQPGLVLNILMTASSSDFYSFGEIVLYAGVLVPELNHPCDGRLLAIAQNSALYSKLGTTFGGNGTTNFALPDLRGCAIIGAGQAPGHAAYALGAASGAESIVLTLAQLPAHSHSLPSGSTGETGENAAVNNRQPTLPLHYQIMTGGIYPSAGSGLSSDLFLADVRIYAGLNAIYPMLTAADGRVLAVADYDALGFLLGARYGGDGVNSFGLPDLRGRLVAGAPAPTTPGATYGTESYTLTVAQLPAHSHEALSARELWRIEYFGSPDNTGDAADGATPRGDGVPNLLKFATGLDPRFASTQPGAIARNGANLEFVYPRSITAATEVIFTIEWSDSLAAGSWSTTGVTEEVLGTAGGVQTVKASVPLDSAARRFIRLRVTP